MKACSFLPAATRMIYDMGLQDLLHGVTFECPAPEEKARVVRCLLEGKSYSSQEIDKIFSHSKASGKSLYYVDDELLQRIAPDIVFTQDICEVCQIDTEATAKAVYKLKNPPLLISLNPQNLDDVYQSALTIARVLNHEDAAYGYLSGLQKRTQRILDRLRENHMPLKRASLFEWIDPIYNCGHWIPFQIGQAGAVDLLGNPGGDSIVIDFEKVSKYNPQILIIAPCGFETRRTLEEMEILRQKAGWEELQAVQDKKVYIMDYELFTQPSPSTLVDGIELLSALIHPQIFEIPMHLKHKFQDFFKIKAHVQT